MKFIVDKNISKDEISIFFALTYLIFSIYLMFIIYPHEDALILFRYVENFTSNYEITFNLNGEKTEGATDFLWFFLLSILNLMGINVVLSSILINSIAGLFIIFSIRKYFINKESIINNLILIFIFFNIGSIFGSSFYGFSTLFFLSLGLQCYLSSISKSFTSWTIFSILLCLTRPEGVLIFLPTLYIIFSLINYDEKIKFYKSFLTICFVGILYFLLRYYYFGNFLPLPITVKNIGGELSITRVLGISLQIINTFIFVVILSSIYSLFKNFKKIFKQKKILKIFIVTFFIWGLYLVILSSGYLSQNIIDRYYASFHIFLFLNFLYFFSFLYEKEKKIILLFLILSSLDGSNLISKLMGKENLHRKSTIYNIFSNLKNHKDPNRFALINVGKVFKNEKLKIMLTEAGAIPYISKQSEIFDMVGLNNNIFATRPVNCNDIKNISPDIIEIDISSVKNFNLNMFTDTNPTNFCGFYSKSYLFEKFLNSKNVNIILEYKNKKNKIDNHKNSTVYVAPNNVIFCLLKNDNYSLVFNNKTKPDQFYFLKNKNYKKIKNSCNMKNSGYFADLIKSY